MAHQPDHVRTYYHRLLASWPARTTLPTRDEARLDWVEVERMRLRGAL
jgi:hypothetical protein